MLLDLNGKIKLSDFGSAKQVANGKELKGWDTSNEVCHSLKGSPNWMAPEVAN